MSWHARPIPSCPRPAKQQRPPTLLATRPSVAKVPETTAAGVTTPNQGCASAAVADSRLKGSYLREGWQGVAEGGTVSATAAAGWCKTGWAAVWLTANNSASPRVLSWYAGGG